MIFDRTVRSALLIGVLVLSGCAHPVAVPKTPPAIQPEPFASQPVPVIHSNVYRAVLDNGVVVIVLPRPVVPVVSFRIGILAGSSKDPLGKSGLADLTASLLNRGTTHWDALTIFRKIDASGGSLEAAAGRDMTTVSGKVLTSDLKPLFSLAADLVLNPVFPKPEFERNLQQAKAGLMDEKDHAGPVARNLFYKSLYGNGPYGHPSNGTLHSLSRIRYQDIFDFYHTHYTPDQTILTFAGDITPEEALKLAKSAFGNWKIPASASLLSLKTSTPAPSALEGRTLLLDRPQFTQTMVMMGSTGIRRNDPRFYSALVMNQILGGTTTSHLNHQVRQKNGLVYYIYSGLDAERHAGPFFVAFQTFAPNTTKVLSLTGKLIAQMKNQPVSTEEVNTTRNNLLGQFPFRVDTDDRIASLLLFVETYQLGLTYFTDYPERVRQVTPESVQAAARDLLHPNHLLTVVVGPIQKTGLIPNGKDILMQ
ncbi:MAG: M16 family metallopeptidase [Leptospirales bacterium]